MTERTGVPEKLSSILKRISSGTELPTGKNPDMAPEHFHVSIESGSILKQRYQSATSFRVQKPVFNKRYGGMQCRVYLVRENNEPQPIIIKTAEIAYDLVKEELAGADREILVSILLTSSLRLIGVETVAVGIHNIVGASTGELFKSAILANANAIILCHNHPAGGLIPSSEDIKFTENVIKCGKILGINLKDHLIVSPEGYLALAERRFVTDEKLTLFPPRQ